VPPQKSGKEDLRSENFLRAAEAAYLKPGSVVLISTTGVYGDADGEWVDESMDPRPRTERAIRRLDQEQKWQAWTQSKETPLRILRVPGIYAKSRIPLERLQKGVPVVRADECGFSNRIHADDLSMAVIAAMNYNGDETIFNATDGMPSKITEYLQSAAEVAGLPPLPEISMEEAENQLSPAMLSYLLESRRIRNQRLLEELGVKLRYPDFRQGLLR
jgi:nucleoside-diphosphate-sugar epimerase